MIVEALMPRAAQPAPTDDFWYADAPTRGMEVTPNSSLQSAAVLACVRVLAETVAQLPLHLMRQTNGMRQRDTADPLYRILNLQFNERQTSYESREQMQAHLALRGNAYGFKLFEGTQLTQIIPLDPTRMQVLRLDQIEDRPQAPRLGYLYRDLSGKRYAITQEEMFHLKFMSLDGMLGISPIAAGRRAIELSMQSEYHGLMWWKNAAKPGGVIKMPAEAEPLDEDAHQRLRKSWREAHTGSDLYTVAILEDGADWQAIGINNEDSEWLENRRFQITEICRIFRIPPHMVASAIEHGMTYANVEHSDLSFLKHTILPWLRRWEQRIQLDLIDDPEQYPKFAVEGLLRADTTTRANFYTAMFGIGVFSQNDILELEDRNPVEGGDQRYIPNNVMPIGASAVADASAGQTHSEKYILAAWAHDAAQRIASAETRELELHSENHKAAMEWATTYWRGKHRTYIQRTIAELCAYYERDVSDVAEELCNDAESDMVKFIFTEGDLLSAVKHWSELRIPHVTAKLLCKESSNGSAVKAS